MNSSPLTLYTSLAEGQIIGPDHHRFKLVGAPSEHPLGLIWQAEDQSTAHSVIVSLFIIKPELVQKKSFITAFKKQIIQAKSFSHKHLLAIYGHFVHRGGLLFFATEALDKLTLAKLIADKKVSQLNEQQAKGLLLQLASAADAFLQKARSAHGSIAPDFVFINKESGVKLLPIIPRQLLTEFEESQIQLFQFKAYQSSDCFEPEHKPLPADDIYAIAVAAYAVLTGTPPYSNSEEVDRIAKALKAPSKLGNSQWEYLRDILMANTLNLPRSSTELVKSLFKQDSTEQNNIDDATANAPETSIKTESSTQLSATSSTKRKVNLRALIYPLLFATGMALGIFLSLLYFEKQQTTLYNQTRAWKEQVDILNMATQDQAKTIDLLKKKLDQTDTALTPTASPSTSASTPPSDNFEQFKDALSDGNYGPVMVTLPAGQFRMGDLNGMGDDNEKPVQTILIPRTFALSRFEVTFAEYDHFAQQTGRKLPDDNGWGRGNQPVINVSWQDATAYVKWLSAQTGQAYRLPSEAEWEYAARAGSESAYWWGNELSSGRAVCDECGTEWDGIKPAPVGSTPANPWGLHDLNGNVDEWVADCYDETYIGYPSDGSARTKPSCSLRAMRGGSWFDIGRVIRSASRYRHPAETSRNTWGFRVALSLDN